jgi:hypothetical protein
METVGAFVERSEVVISPPLAAHRTDDAKGENIIVFRGLERRDAKMGVSEKGGTIGVGQANRALERTVKQSCPSWRKLPNAGRGCREGLLLDRMSTRLGWCAQNCPCNKIWFQWGKHIADELERRRAF